MKIKFYFLFILIISTSFKAAPSNKSEAVEKTNLAILKNVLTYKDFTKYLSSNNIPAFPMQVKFRNKIYVLHGPNVDFIEVALKDQKEDAYFLVETFKRVEDEKIKIKISYLDRKFRFATVPKNSCCWRVQSFLARKAGGVKGLKSNFYYSYN